MNMKFKQRGFIWIEQILQDIRFSLRMLRKKPGFTVIAVISLALAIGVNCGVFWFVNEILFRPVTSLRPDEVVNVYVCATAADSPVGEWRKFSFPEFSLLRESDEVFADVSAFQETMVGIGAKNGEEMQWRQSYFVSDNYFSLLGVTPIVGRFFLPEESKPNAKIPVAVVSQAMWKSMGGGNDFSERTIAINGEICTIVGVAPNGVGTGIPHDIWLPMGMAFGDYGQDLADASTFTLYITARLQPGLTMDAAKARLPVLAARLTKNAADTAGGTRNIEIGPPLRFELSTSPMSIGQVTLFCALAMGMAGVVLLVACLNLANMLLARNITRSQELTVRMALGASRRRIIRILSVEGLILALMGGAVGLLVSRFGISLSINSLMSSSAFTASGASLSLNTTPDIRVLLATLLFSVIATLIFAVAPARHAIRGIVRGNLSLQHSTRTTTGRWGSLFSGRYCLLMAQLGLSMALLFSAGLFLRAAYAAARLDLGFAPKGDLVAEIDYSCVNRDEGSVRNAIAAIAETLRAHPGVRKVALASTIPFGNSQKFDAVTTAGATGKHVRPAVATVTAVSNGYFDTMGIKLLRGRDFTNQECKQSDGPSVVIIDQGMAAVLFPGEDPLGKYIQNMPRPNESAPVPMEIVGVVSAHWDSALEESPSLRIFFPLAKEFPQRVFVHVRGQTDDAATSDTFRVSVRSKLLSLDPDIPVVRLTPYQTLLDGDIMLWVLRFAAVLFGLFGAIALLLAVIGVYGVRAFVIARSMREIGIRMALGATRRRIYALLMKQGAVQIAIGLGAGLMLSLAAGKLLASILVRVSPEDPVVLGIVAPLLAFTALLATWIPARRAAKVDPMEVLRWE